MYSSIYSIGAGRLDDLTRFLYIAPAMTYPTHGQWHRPVEKTVPAAVCLRAGRDSAGSSRHFARLLANGPDPGP